MFVSRRVYLTDTKTDRIDWNKGNNVSVFALSFPCLNRLHMHNEHAHFLCPSILVWYSLHITHGDHKDKHTCTAHELLMQLCTNMQGCKKYSDRVTNYTRVTHSHAQSLNRAVSYLTLYIYNI